MGGRGAGTGRTGGSGAGRELTRDELVNLYNSTMMSTSMSEEQVLRDLSSIRKRIEELDRKNNRRS